MYALRESDHCQLAVCNVNDGRLEIKYICKCSLWVKKLGEQNRESVLLLEL